MGAIAGKDGKFTFDASVMAYIDTFNLNINGGTAETNSLGKSYKEFIPTVTDWSGSASGSLDLSDPSQKGAVKMLTAGGNVAIKTAEFAVGEVGTFSGSVIASSVAIGAAHGDKMTFSLNFQGTGPLSFTEGE